MIQLGIDVGKSKIDLCLKSDGPEGSKKTKVLPNGPDVAVTVLGWLMKQKISPSEVQVIMEPTGTYHDHLAYGLYDRAIRVVIANPARVRAFAQGMGILTKNDTVDADVLARYGAMRQPEAWLPPSPAIRELKALLSRRDALLQDVNRENNRLEKLLSTRGSAQVELSVRKILQALNGELEAVQALTDDHIDTHPDLKRDMEYLTSIKGVGAAVGSTLLTVLRGNHFRSAEQAAAWLGVVPKEKRSGSSIRGRTRLSKCGPPAVRAKLYMAALVAAKYNPHLKAFYERLVSTGKAKRSALGGVMRKLVHICYSVLMKQQKYDENYTAAA
ncbi:IS110 family transposase [Pluralibacter gergoviae]|uniref:IS110 family transposase n=1 Tax=Pluralibacter gergoviae TaxID=61647 RepID=UPI00190B95A2|nr:IS110 family transposase [Pluralibacter gergoviae]MBK4115786.1 IS110 family transposase [Pluralibacter gergoviae]MDU4001497.1 IS110 family transposase [Pluralibacter gergoviae]HDS1237852.1 IS110 family transposase [Pluralibacter gergoviae]HDS1241504.1 IS110 family transposase [Pluralibacter gergoviae]HDS1249114.1 IS110 family transposase [Pluralibacter gergoviae]